MTDTASTPEAMGPSRATAKKPRFRIELRAGIPEIIWWEGEKSHRRPDYEAFQLAMKGRYGLCIEDCEAIKEIGGTFREARSLDPFPFGDFDTTKQDAKPPRPVLPAEHPSIAEGQRINEILARGRAEALERADQVAELVSPPEASSHVDSMLAVEHEHPAPIVEDDEPLPGFKALPQFRIKEDGQIDLFDPDGPLEAGRKARELQKASPTPGDLAELITSQIRIEAVELGPGSEAYGLMWWDGRIYRPNADKVIASCVQTIMGRKAKKEFVNETVAFVERMKHLLVRSVERSKICVKNGVLDLDTGELLPFRPDLVFTSLFPIVYDPQAEAYHIGKFLDDVLDPEQGTDPEGRKLDFYALTEYLGTMLEPGYRWQKGAILLGSGSNGKSVLLQVITAFLGPENVASVSMEDLGGGNRYAAANLVGKRANICGDISDRAMKDVATLKKATGGDAIYAERKYGQPFTFTNEAKMVFSCNTIPESPDLTMAWTRRWLIFNFPQQFIGADADPNLVKKLTTPRELSGLLNLALEGRKRLIQQGYFTGHNDAEKDRERYLMASDPATSFLARRCYSQFQELQEGIGPATPIPRTESTELYLAFVDWCKENRVTPVALNKFSEKVQRVFPGVSKQRRWIGDRKKDARYVSEWIGLGLYPPD